MNFISTEINVSDIFFRWIKSSCILLFIMLCVACKGTVPVADSQSNVTVNMNSSRVIALTASGDPTSWSIEKHPAHGIFQDLDLENYSDVTYIPNEDYEGSDSFTFTATNDAGTSAPATVAINVAKNDEENRYYVFQANSALGSYLYLQARDKVIFIASEISIPISLKSSEASYQTPLGGGSNLEGQELSERLESPILFDMVINDHVMGDVTGDGVSEVFIPALGIIITGLEGEHTEHGGNPYVLAQYNELGGMVINFYDALTNRFHVKPGLSFELYDINGDGRADLVIKQPGKNAVVNFAGTDGKFPESTVEPPGPVVDPKSSADLKGYSLVSGAVAGSFSVESGAANYSIAIAAPAGTAGVIPKFSLTYSSNAGNGIVGLGWGVSGYSMMSRCAKNYLHDGEKTVDWYGVGKNGEPFDYDAEQNLCLDNQKLVLVSGNYWQDGAEYRTEHESSIKIKQHGNSDNAWFEAFHKSGDVFQYGNGSSSKATMGAHTSTWAVNKVQDAAGNYMVYEYSDFYAEQGITQILKVDYTGNESVGLAPYNSVVFGYEDRKEGDFITSYNPASPGETFILTHRLKSITTLVEGNTYRKYILGYRTDIKLLDAFSKLQEVYECNGFGECTQPTTFNWTSEHADYKISEESSLVSIFVDENINKSYDYKTIQYPNVNGDGYVDICGRTRDGIKCILGTSEGFTGDLWSSPICRDRPSIIDEHACLNHEDWHTSVRFIDVNGNGNDDLVWVGTNGVNVALSDPSASTFQFQGPEGDEVSHRNKPIGWSVNMGGNKGIKDLTNLPNTTVYNPSDEKGNVKFPDINGDSLPDVCFRSSTWGIRCVLNVTGTIDLGTGEAQFGWDQTKVIETNICFNGDNLYPECNSSDNHKTIQFVDYNNDGMDDIYYLSSAGFTLLLSEGLEFSEFRYVAKNDCSAGSASGRDISCTKAWLDDGATFQFVDFTGDGLPEYCVTTHTNFTWLDCFENTGSGVADLSLVSLFGYKNSTIPGESVAITQISDFNRDGRPDIFALPSDRTKKSRVDLTHFQLNKYYPDRVKVNYWPAGVSKFCVVGCTSNDVYGTIRFIDTDGDGKSEVIHRTSEGMRIYDIGSAKNPGHISKIVNGFGLTTSVEFADPNDPDVYDKGESVTYPLKKSTGSATLVKSITTSNGIGGKLSSEYFYTGLTHQLTGAGSLGFESIAIKKEIRSNVYETNTTYYSMDYQNHTEGMPIRSVSTIDDVVVSESENIYDTIVYGVNDNIVTGKTSIFNGDDGGATDRQRYFMYTKTNLSKRFDPKTGDLLSATTKESTIGKYADQLTSRTIVADTDIVVSESGDVTPPTSGSYLITSASNEYDYNDPSQWYLGKLSETTVTKSGVTVIPDAIGGSPLVNVMEPITRKSRWTYFSDTGAIKTEEVVLLDKFGVESVDTIKISEIDTSHDGRVYPNFGVPNRTTTYEVIGGSNVNGRTQAVFSDPKGRYAVAKADSQGNTVYTTYNPVLGLKQTVKGINGLTTTWEYDGWGRPLLQTNPDGTWLGTQIYGCGEGDATCPKLAAYYVRTHQSGSTPSYAFIDVFGRTIQTQVTGFNGETIYTNRVYNAIGQEWKVGLPSFSKTLSNSYDYEEHKYDDSGRLIETIKPGGTSKVGGVKQEILYSGLNQTLLNRYRKADGSGITTQMKKLYFDPFGRLIQTQDYLNNVVQFVFDAYGNKLETRLHYADVESDDYTITMAYDAMGRKTAMSDPSKGDWRYIYNKRGELILQEDGNNVKICHQYDSYGRLIKRFDGYYGSDSNAILGCVSGGPSTAEWIYDTAPKTGVLGGFWKGVLHQVKGENGYEETYYYDDMARVSNAVVTIDSSIFITTSVFDSLGRVKETFYPGQEGNKRLQVVNQYNSLGFLDRIEDAKGAHYWRGVTSDAFGRITEESYGSGVIKTNKNYNEYNGTITNIHSNRIGGEVLQDDAFLFDGVGNLAYREIKAEGINLTETYTFDAANRLKKVSFKDANNSAFDDESTMDYMGNGNIKSKPGVGSYLYGDSCSANGNDYQPSSHAVTSVNGDSYCYDVVGNLLTGGGRTVQWSAFNKPTRIDKGTSNVQLVYGPDRKRIQRIDDANGKITKTTYLGKSYEKIEKDGNIEEKHFIGGFAVVSVKGIGVDKVEKTRYLLKDHLGSTTAIVGMMDGDLQRLAYDPWGKRRNAINWQALSDNAITDFTETLVVNRGFTGHEMLDPVGLVHMNGRVYDPVIGRFLSADPIVQAPTNSQSYNRYSYVANNPVSYTDPSGFSFFSKIRKSITKAFKKITKTIYRISGMEAMVRFAQRRTAAYADILAKNPALGAIIQVVGCVIFSAACPLIVAAVSGLTTYGVTGDWQMALKAGAIAGATAFVSAGVNGAIGGGLQGFGNIAAHAAFSGVMSVAQGGDFWSGAIEGAVTAGIAVGGLYNGTIGNAIGKVGRTAVAAVIGGTMSRFTGGKFSNGAASAAFSHLYNHEGEGHKLEEYDEFSTDRETTDEMKSIRKLTENFSKKATKSIWEKIGDLTPDFKKIKKLFGKFNTAKKWFDYSQNAGTARNSVENTTKLLRSSPVPIGPLGYKPFQERFIDGPIKALSGKTN